MASVQPSSSPSFTTHPLHPNVGVEIRGLDLREPPDAETGAALRDLLPRHGVLLFRDVNITEDQQVAFSRTFGDLEEHVEGNIRHRQRREFIRISNVGEDGNIIDPEDSARRYLYELTCMWHTDSSFREIPALASLLYALEVPAPGSIPDTDARTCYVDMCHAYETLPDELLSWSTRDECVYSHQWRQNDLVMWDNRVTMHRVTPYDQYNVRRALRRTTVVGDGPVI